MGSGWCVLRTLCFTWGLSEKLFPEKPGECCAVLVPEQDLDQFPKAKKDISAPGDMFKPGSGLDVNMQVRDPSCIGG